MARILLKLVRGRPAQIEVHLPAMPHHTLLDVWYASNSAKEREMLILTRKAGEKLMIGDDVELSVLSIKGNQVRIGVEAPKDVAVHREEVYLRIQNENQKVDS